MKTGRRLVLSVAILGMNIGLMPFLSLSKDLAQTHAALACRSKRAGSAVTKQTMNQTEEERPSETSEVTVIAAAGPITLGPTSTVVTLSPAAMIGGSLASHASTLGFDRQMLVVLRGMHATQPPGVLFHLYLDLPAGEKAAKNSPHHIGVLNFYNSVETDGSTRSASDSFFSYDITALVRNLLAKKLLREQTTVTIIPSVTPAREAKATIDRIELVEQ